MNVNGDTKQLLANQIQKILDSRIETSIRDIEMLEESRDNETKSSAGDKYETGREMVQFEIEKINLQLNKSIQLKNELSRIDIHKKYKKAEYGSLVLTSHDNYFISIGMGKIETGDKTVYCISLASPIGKTLLNKRIGDKIKFQENEFIITEIV